MGCGGSRRTGPVAAGRVACADAATAERCRRGAADHHPDLRRLPQRSRQGRRPLADHRFTVAAAADHLETTEKMIRKLRAGQMPPAGSRRPDDAALNALAATLEAQADAARRRDRAGPPHASSASTAPSTRGRCATCSGSTINAGDYLPLDTKSANFDNIADAQLLSPTVMQGYLTAAAEISRLAVGDRDGDGPRSHLPGVALDVAARAGRGRAVRHPRRPGGDAHVPGRRPVPLPRVVLPRDHRRAVRQRPRRAAHRRGARAGGDRRRRRARGAARRRPLDEQLRSRRRQPAHRADCHHRRSAPRVGGVHPPASRGRCRT